MNGFLNNQRGDKDPEADPVSQVETAPRGTKEISSEEVEEYFRQMMRSPLEEAAEIREADIVVGIPFYNEADTIGSVVATVREGLEEYYPEKKCVIVAVGSPVGEKALEVIKQLPQSQEIRHIAFLASDQRLDGKGWSIRAIAEIARSLGADLAILEADLRSRQKNGETEGLTPEWITLLLEPIIREKMDLVISRFNRHYLESTISTHLVYPLLTAIYHCPVQDTAGGQWGISYQLLRTYLKDTRQLWSSEISGHGVDSWLVTTAITSGARICEVNLGIKIHRTSAAKTELVLRSVARVLFDQIIADKEWWGELETVGEVPLLQPVATFGTRKQHQPDEVPFVPQEFITKYQRGFNRFHLLYQGIFTEEVYGQLEKLAATEAGQFDFPAELWARIVYRYLLNFAFGGEFARGDLRNSFIPLYQGCIAGFAQKIQSLKVKMGKLLPDEVEHLASLEAQRRIEVLVDEFIHQKTDFLAAWEMREEAFKPPVPKVTYREFIPGVPLVVPLELTNPEGETVTANGIYDSLFNEHREDFENFIYEYLKVPRDAGSQVIGSRVRDFLRQVEKGIDTLLLPGDLSTTEGTQEVVDALFRYFSHQDTFALSSEMTYWLLWQHPPFELITKLGYSNLDELLNDYEPNDALALAGWSEEREYVRRIWALITENIRPEHFQSCAVQPLVVSHHDFPALVEMRESGAFGKIMGRIVISNLHKGMGGEFPKLQYFTHIAKYIVEIESFGRIWQGFAEERKEFGSKVINSLEGHWGKDPLSAHNIFENRHQIVLVERIGEIAQQIRRETGVDGARLSLAEHLERVVDSYHLAFTLPDGTFLPCSAWTWASYSFRGGRGVPTPLSLHVERDWSSQEFLTEYFKAAGGTEEEIDQKLVELIEQGREWEDLSPILLGEVKEAENVISWPVATSEWPPAGALVRYPGNPVIEPVSEHSWESKYVLNPGAIKLEGKVYIIYRAVGEDDISRLGMAVSEDGFQFNERLAEPVFAPKGPREEKGCEDPRLTLIGDRIYMVYTAYSGLIAQIALASIGVADFLKYNWGSWRRHGLVFPTVTNKDATLFPAQFDGKFALLHRVDPHIWITFSPHLRCPWPRKEHRILAGSSSGMAWDGKKIGAGAQPVPTRYGWLLITHGVDYAYVYRLGAMLLDLADPSKIVYRSPNFILEPEARCETGVDFDCWVPNVVFACGAVPQENNKERLDADDELLIYYGASDSAICVATAKIADLIPEEFRQ